MKRLFYFIIITILAVILSSCHKNDDATLTGREKFIGTYSGTKETLIDANSVLIIYNNDTINKTIDAGIGENDIIIGKGTDFEFDATVDGNRFDIPGQVKTFTLENLLTPISVSLLGQGVFDTSNLLTITYSGFETYDNTEYKWTIVEKLTKDK